MALLGSSLTNEVGLRLVLCPLGSNIVIRTACCSMGIVLPVYSTFKAIERKDQYEQRKWLIYWAGWNVNGGGTRLYYNGILDKVLILHLLTAAAYGSFSVAEIFADKFLFWFPMYYHLKFAFLVWLQLPSADGARQLYRNYLRPFLLRHQNRIDRLLTSAYGEMLHVFCGALVFGRGGCVRLISTHREEIEFGRNMILKIFWPDQPQGSNAIEGPAGITTDMETEFDHED